jgi:Na+/H+-dicarboxylate symporter
MIMERHETINNFLNELETKIVLVANFIWYIIQVALIFAVIALLYENGFIGASILLFNLLKFFAIFTILCTVVWGYFKLIAYVLKRAEPKRKLRRELFKQELKKEILKEMYGKRTK